MEERKNQSDLNHIFFDFHSQHTRLSRTRAKETANTFQKEKKTQFA